MRRELVDSPSPSSCHTPDEVLARIGPLNPYILFIFTTKATVWMLTAAITLMTSFIIGDICDTGTNCTQSADEASLAGEFHLTGQQAGWAVLTSFLLGMGTGGCVFPVISDWKGRRLVLCGSMLMVGLTGMASSFSPVLAVYVAMRALQGFFFMGCGVVAMIMAYESVPMMLRPYTTALFGLTWVVGYCAVAPLAYWWPHWRHLTRVVSGATIVYGIFLAATTAESFHFMAVRKNCDGLAKWLENANCAAGLVGLKGVPFSAEEIHCVEPREKNKASLPRLLFTNRLFLLYSMAMVVLFLSDILVYYSLSIFTEELQYDKYWKHVYTGLVELPAGLLAPFLMNRLGRRCYISASNVAAAVALLVIAFGPGQAVGIFAWLVAKCGVTAAYLGNYIYAAEVFPTVTRNACIGFFSLTARFSAAAVPIIPTLASVGEFLPPLTYSCFTLLCALVVWVLPETSNKELPDQPEEMIVSGVAKKLIKRGSISTFSSECK